MPILPNQATPEPIRFFFRRYARYIGDNNGLVAIAECANGFLTENLKAVELGWLADKPSVKIIDLDLEEFDRVVVYDEEHFLPKCLKDYEVRIGIPSASKRSEMVFSNNVKLFVGAVPRSMYQIGEPVGWRPRVHINLHKSVANIYRAVQQYAPFRYYINGGIAMDEKRWEFRLDNILVGTDAIELDQYVLENDFNLEPPEYLVELLKYDSYKTQLKG